MVLDGLYYVIDNAHRHHRPPQRIIAFDDTTKLLSRNKTDVLTSTRSIPRQFSASSDGSTTTEGGDSPFNCGDIFDGDVSTKTYVNCNPKESTYIPPPPNPIQNDRSKQGVCDESDDPASSTADAIATLVSNATSEGSGNLSNASKPIASILKKHAAEIDYSLAEESLRRRYLVGACKDQEYGATLDVLFLLYERQCDEVHNRNMIASTHSLRDNFINVSHATAEEVLTMIKHFLQTDEENHKMIVYVGHCREYCNLQCGCDTMVTQKQMQDTLVMYGNTPKLYVAFLCHAFDSYSEDREDHLQFIKALEQDRKQKHRRNCHQDDHEDNFVKRAKTQMDTSPSSNISAFNDPFSISRFNSWSAEKIGPVLDNCDRSHGNSISSSRGKPNKEMKVEILCDRLQCRIRTNSLFFRKDYDVYHRIENEVIDKYYITRFYDPTLEEDDSLLTQNNEHSTCSNNRQYSM